MPIYWTDKEFDFVAERVASGLAKNPEVQYKTLLDNAQQQMPENRRRKFPNKKIMEPITNRVRKIFQDWKQPQYLKQSKESMAESFTDEEVAYFFKDRVLNQIDSDELTKYVNVEDVLREVDTPKLVGYAAQKAYEGLCSSPDKLTSMFSERPVVNVPKKNKKPKALIVGLKPDQRNIVASKVKNLNLSFVDSKVKSIPDSDYYFVWSKFSSHAIEYKIKSRNAQDRMVRHHGGLNDLIAKLQSV